MAPPAGSRPADDALREAASMWFARMRGPEAARHRDAFVQWLAADPAHQAAYDRMRLRWHQAGLVGHTASGEAREGLPAPRRRQAVIVALAASVLAVLGFALVLRPGSESVPAHLVVARTLASPVGPAHRVALPDGSVVTLDTDSRVALDFTASVRRLRLLQGRARFEVAKDGRPFIVAAGAREIVALGTVFDVSLIGTAPQVELLEGVVEVRAAKPVPGAAPAATRLAPGQRLVLDPAAAVPQPAARSDSRWASGMLSFENAPLDEVVSALNRYSARKILLDGTALAELRVTGSFRTGDPRQLADSLAATFRLRVSVRADGTLALSR